MAYDIAKSNRLCPILANGSLAKFSDFSFVIDHPGATDQPKVDSELPWSCSC